MKDDYIMLESVMDDYVRVFGSLDVLMAWSPLPWGNGILLYATTLQKPNVIMSLMKRGCDLDLEDSFHYTPLWYAVSCGFIEVVKYLINKVNVEKTYVWGRTYLDLAITVTQPDVVKLLTTNSFLQRNIRKFNLDVRVHKSPLAIRGDVSFSSNCLRLDIYLALGRIAVTYLGDLVHLFKVPLGEDATSYYYLDNMNDGYEQSRLPCLLQIMGIMRPYHQFRVKVTYNYITPTTWRDIYTHHRRHHQRLSVVEVFNGGANACDYTDLSVYPKISCFVDKIMELAKNTPTLFSLAVVNIQRCRPESMSLDVFKDSLPLPPSLQNMLVGE
jgi:hypothetical protein